VEGFGRPGDVGVLAVRAVAEAGYRAVSLSVERDNPSRRIYERAGFERVAERGGSWTMVARLDEP
jgi:hypothetical protein